MNQQLFEDPQQQPVAAQTPADQLFLNASLGLIRWRRWVLGVIAIIVIWLILGTILANVAIIAIGIVLSSALPLAIRCADLRTANIYWFTCDDLTIKAHSPIGEFVLVNLAYAVGLVGVWIVVKLIHKKRLTQVVTGRTSFDYSRVLYAMPVGLFISLLGLLIVRFTFPVEMTFRVPVLWEYLPFVLLALVLTPLQAGLEEVIFRGYILQGLILLTRNKLVLALVTTVVFVLPHLANPEPWAYGVGWYVIGIMSMGTFFALLTLLDGGIELAVGFHAIHNLFIILVANRKVSVFETPSLFVIHGDQSAQFATFLLSTCSYALLVAICNQKYEWFTYAWFKNPWSKLTHKS